MFKNIISETGDCICKKIGNKECNQKVNEEV